LVQFSRRGQSNLGDPLRRPPHGGARVASRYRIVARGAGARTDVNRFLGTDGGNRIEGNRRGTVEN
jgi:hypothetical protein